MKYVDYEELVVIKYGIKLQGWTFDKFACPSSLSTSLPGLRKLLNAINNGECKFVKLSPLEVKKLREEREKQIEDGAITVKARKTRKDLGTKRPRTKGKKKAAEVDNDSDDGDSDEDNRPRKRRSLKSAEIVPSDSN
jgi:hypothetical protein